jgi:uncharacterized protein
LPSKNSLPLRRRASRFKLLGFEATRQSPLSRKAFMKSDKPSANKAKANSVSETSPASAVKPQAAAKEAAAKPKSAAKKPASAAPVVPPILLEGDQPPAPAVGGPGQRYALGPTPPSDHIGGASGELPEAYGTKRLLLAARDPHWLYARWDLSRSQQRGYNALSIDHHLVLRIFLHEAKGHPLVEVHVHPESTHWFIPVAHAGTKYVGELGYYATDGVWNNISTSGATLTPPDSMSEDYGAEFATIPTDIPFAQLMELAQTAVQENVPLVEIIQQLRASGYKLPTAQISEKWTPERQRAVAAIITMDSVRRVWMGSLEITELIRRQLQQEISSMSAAQFGVPGSMLGGISSISSVTSPFGGQERKKGFWFNVNAELIIYGATEPDAQVTIGGREIKLRPDGTFSYHFILPDGKFELPAVAISSDKTDGRAADLKFSRHSEYHGDVGAHPQDPQMKPPLVENIA